MNYVSFRVIQCFAKFACDFCGKRAKLEAKSYNPDTRLIVSFSRVCSEDCGQ